MVKINFKTVQNKLFSIEAEDSETVADVKSKIQESQSFPSGNQKLIYSGKILQDGATVGSLNIKEKDFLVVMVSKPKAQPAPAPASAAAASTSTPAAPSAPTTTETPAQPAATEAPAAAAPTEPAAAESAPSGFGGGSFLSGPALQSAISSLTEMGFERDQVMRAMKASFNNPDRAVEYLMNGDIPEVESSRPAAPPAAAPAPRAAPAAAPAPTAQPAPAQPAPPPSGGDGSSENLFAAAEAAMNRDRGMPAGGPGGLGAGLGGAGAGAGAGAGLGGAADALANSPQIRHLRALVQQNPALIQPLLQQLATANPQLAQAINQNPEALYELLGINPEGGEEGDEDFLGPQVMQVNLTEDEAAAVARLEALGFERQMVLQAYMLCDKNEELAANFLFDSGEDDQ